jgi:hypothetical protein
VKRSTPYPINLSAQKLKQNIRCVGTDGPDAFNMGVCILEPIALQKVKGQQTIIRKHYMDLEFNVCH